MVCKLQARTTRALEAGMAEIDGRIMNSAEIDGRIMNSAEPKNVEFPLGGEIPDDLGKLYQAGGPTPWSHHLR